MENIETATAAAPKTINVGIIEDRRQIRDVYVC